MGDRATFNFENQPGTSIDWESYNRDEQVHTLRTLRGLST